MKRYILIIIHPFPHNNIYKINKVISRDCVDYIATNNYNYCVIIYYLEWSMKQRS